MAIRLEDAGPLRSAKLVTSRPGSRHGGLHDWKMNPKLYLLELGPQACELGCLIRGRRAGVLPCFDYYGQTM